MRILLVDDSEDSRDLTEGALLSAGFDDVITANSGWDALKILDVGRADDGRTAERRPTVDLVLLDVVMPDIDGVETCARIRKDERWADLPIIMVTSLDDVSSLNSAFAAGANDYVTKPINGIELIARVRAALRLKAELDRRQERERELLNFLSSWGDRRASLWIDEVTGLFVGEVAEAYLAASSCGESNDTISILALMIDRLDAYGSVNGEQAAQRALARVGCAIRRHVATIGVVSAAYRNGMIVVVAPELDANAAHRLGEELHAAISKPGSAGFESTVSGNLTASVAVITARAKRDIDRIYLLSRAIARVQDVTGGGGNRVVALTA
jgi:PleD family two-component response regulator